MKRYKSLDEKTVEEIKKNADSNICESGSLADKFTYIFEKEGVICNFLLHDNSGFTSPLLKSYYYLSVTFFEVVGIGKDRKVCVYPFQSEKAKGIVKKFFPETKSVWEHAPFTKDGIAANTHHFYLFVSIPYSKKTVKLQLQDMQELVNNKFVLYEQEEEK